MADALFIWWFLGAFWGFLYPAVVGLTFVVCLVARPAFRPRPGQWLPLVAPAAVYYLLAYAVGDRQGFNLIYPPLALAIFGAVVLIAACVARRSSWLLIGSALGVVLAFALWLLVPHQGMTRLF